MSSSSATTTTVSLTTSDGSVFVVEEALAAQIPLVKSCLEACDTVIPLPKVTSEMLSLVISYWTGRLQLPDESELKLKEYNAEFLKKQIIDDLAKISFAANYLEITDLLDVSNRAIADRIKNKSVEYVRNLKFWGFDPKTDFWTKEEEEEFRTNNPFAFEDIDLDDDDSQLSK